MHCLASTLLQHIFLKWTQRSAGYSSNLCLFSNYPHLCLCSQHAEEAHRIGRNTGKERAN